MLGRHPQIELVRHSSWYETEPLGIDSVHKFINGVAELRTNLSARALMDQLLLVERALGRDRSLGVDRPIDLDILYMEGTVLGHGTCAPGTSARGTLIIPHPRICERLFVLEPWAELAPDLVLPLWKGPCRIYIKRFEGACPVSKEPARTPKKGDRRPCA